jgi:hypothetical protein
MDCTQGVGNKVEPWQAAAMLYWLIHTFELPVDMKSRIESIIAPFGPRLKTFFDSPY